MRFPLAAQCALLIGGALLTSVRRARACSVCGCDDPLVAAGNSAPNVGSLRLALSLSAVTAAAESDDDPLVTERLNRHVLTLTAVYSPLRNVNLVAAVPAQRNLYSVTGSDVPSESHSLWGLGDVELSGRYFAWTGIDWAARRRQELALSVGSSLPTGPNDARAAGERLDEHAQLGRGAFGPYVGLSYAFHQDPWNFNASALGRVFTTNHYGYRYGSSLLWSATLQFRAWDVLAFEIGTDDHYELHDVQSGTTQANTGGLVLQATPGLLAEVSGGLWFEGKVEIPAYTRLNGHQSLGPTYLLLLRYAP